MKPSDFDRVVCAISHSKKRKKFGLVATGLLAEGRELADRKLYVGYAKQWDRNELDFIVPEIKKQAKRQNFSEIIIDQQVGQHFIKSLNMVGLNTKVITTAKNLKDVKGIERLDVLDKIEMTQLFLTLKNNYKIRFPENGSLKMLEDQVPIFAEHITEAGTADYYAKGNEPDDLIKSLIMCAFSCRNDLTQVYEQFVGGQANRGRKPRRRNTLGSRSDFYSDASVVAALSNSGAVGRYFTGY